MGFLTTLYLQMSTLWCQSIHHSFSWLRLIWRADGMKDFLFPSHTYVFQEHQEILIKQTKLDISR